MDAETRNAESGLGAVKPWTVDVRRDTVACRMVALALTDADRDFIRASVKYRNVSYVRFAYSERLCRLLEIPT